MGAYESQISPADFDGDGQLDCADVDALVAAIVAADNPAAFDLTGDAVVNSADLDVWLTLAGNENLASSESYVAGDANLDGKVDASDLNVIGVNWLQSVNGWCHGDFTADGVVNANDLNQLGLHWLLDGSGSAAGGRAPRAPLANRVAPAIADDVTLNSSVFPAMSEHSALSPAGVPRIDHVSSTTPLSLARSHGRRSLRPFLHQHLDTQVNHQQAHPKKHQLVDSVLQRWW
jgi:hypothetical protein